MRAAATCMLGATSKWKPQGLSELAVVGLGHSSLGAAQFFKVLVGVGSLDQ